MYQDDPFSVIIERPPSSGRGSDDASSHASSGFAASSVMTVYRSPHPNANGDGQPLLHPYKPSTGRNGVSPRDRKLSVIVDEDGTSKQFLDALHHDEHKRPPSYEYDFDEKVPDDYDV